MSEVQRGIKSGKYLQGTFQASRENYLEANVFIQDSSKYNQVRLQIDHGDQFEISLVFSFSFKAIEI